MAYVMPMGFGRRMSEELSIVVDYFANIFKSNGSIDAPKVVEVVQPVVTNAMNLGLI